MEKERKVGSSRLDLSETDIKYMYIYIRVIFEGRDEYLCGGAGRDRRWRARERKDKRNRLVSGGGVAAAAGFRGGPGFVTGGRKRSRPLITQLKWTGNHGSPVDVGLDAMATRRVDSVTIIVVLLMPLQVLLFSGGGEGDGEILLVVRGIRIITKSFYLVASNSSAEEVKFLISFFS